MALIKTARPFESKSCGRCGGSGHHSFCQRYGTICFGCGGGGRKLTKRGAAAKAFFNARRPTKTVADLVPGDRLVDSSGSVRTVVEIAPTTSYAIDPVTKQPLVDPATLRNVVCQKVILGGLPLDYVVTVLWTVEQADAAYAEALAYQATLTIKGVPAKVKRRAAKPAAAALVASGETARQAGDDHAAGAL